MEKLFFELFSINRYLNIISCIEYLTLNLMLTIDSFFQIFIYEQIKTYFSFPEILTNNKCFMNEIS